MHGKGREHTRSLVRIRDKNTCQICFKKWKLGQRKFDVHHLNGQCGKKSRGYDKVAEIDGLVTLCHKCHVSLDSVREKMKEGYLKNNEAIVAENRKRYAFIIEMRKRRLTYKAIGEMVGVSRQRIQQIYNQNK